MIFIDQDSELLAEVAPGIVIGNDAGWGALDEVRVAQIVAWANHPISSKVGESAVADYQVLATWENKAEHILSGQIAVDSPSKPKWAADARCSGPVAVIVANIVCHQVTIAVLNPVPMVISCRATADMAVIFRGDADAAVE